MVKEKLEALKAGLPAGVELVTTYDRSTLIERAVDNLKVKLVEETVSLSPLSVCCFCFICARLFVAVVTLPLGILAAFIIMRYQGVNANLMSLGGIAIAIGAMVDAAIVMIEKCPQTY